MARTDERFKHAYNSLLERCHRLGVGARLESESSLAKELDVSRTVIRAALARMDEDGVISWQGRSKTVTRLPAPRERLEIGATPPSQEILEEQFFNWVLHFDVPAGTPLNVAQLAREFQVPSHSLQEFLASLSRFGLVRRRDRGGWELLGFTEEFAVELSDFRTLLELNAISHLIVCPPDHPIWTRLEDLRREHLNLARSIETRYHDFSRLDEQFHEAIGSSVNNRFIKEFQRVISLIFHYHYQWEKQTEQQRNAAAIDEHLALIDALQRRDEQAALAAARAHLATAKNTLRASMRTHNLT
ncbi:GntR family transcriptional regulator [Paracoccus sp. Z330]|uniref:GntR family transcriptional regulator n=1 Tax=Paracoccus onchidii TaxID=3017813 RepID=A0ABT4ZCC2_9RHOB|nr:GntR family transcriptional regulator [Paracoccus onchidii]MDB6176295.1 GntR family transcriptional regulator [Paracoccus onchidii]